MVGDGTRRCRCLSAFLQWDAPARAGWVLPRCPVPASRLMGVGNSMDARSEASDFWLQLDRKQRRALAEQAVGAGDRAALGALTEAFLVQGQARGKRVSPHTLRSYRRSVESLLESWAGERLLRPEPEDVEEIVAGLRDSGVSESTLKVRLAGMRALYGALVWAGVVNENPFAAV